ncbi:MAG: hypothetical protein SOZ83_00180 [Sphaerochaetaceae bacterium]|nr:hypothetical protein [Sphaerochaetaceae bacterium]
MRQQNIKVKMELQIPIDKPDLNGVIYSKGAVEKAFGKSLNGIPLVFRDNTTPEPQIIGLIEDNNVAFNEKTQTFNVNFDGFVMYGGADIIANKISHSKSGVCVEDFKIISIGLSQ